MKIGIWGVIPFNAYSGGRYSAWVIAEALAAAGHDVTFYSNNEPVFTQDFKTYKNHSKINIVENTFKEPLIALENLDVLIIVPTLVKDHKIFYQALDFAKRSLARVVLYNFETPNWYNKLSPNKKNPILWDGWKLVAKYSSAVLSISKEGDKYAQEYYGEVNSDLIYRPVHLAINQHAADTVLEDNPQKKKRIFIPLRLQNASHKGGNLVEKLLTEEFRGYTFVLMVGKFQMLKEMYERFVAKADKAGIGIEFYSNLSDAQKFKQIAYAKALVFPSSFEGYGYPPLESSYCKTPCVCYDLDVLREVGDTDYVFAKKGDFSDFKNKLIEVLNDDSEHIPSESVKNAASFDRFSKELDEFVKEVYGKDYPESLLSLTVPRDKLFYQEKVYTRSFLKKWFLNLKDYVLAKRKNWLFQD